MSTASASMAVPESGSLTFGQAVLWGGLVCGVLDATDGVVAYYLHAGLNPIQVLQYIASGALGESSFRGGLGTAALGAVIHFFIAFVVAAIYTGAAQRWPALKQHWVAFGLTFGAAVYLVMTYVVLPFSRVSPSPFHLGLFMNGVVGHAFFVGLPIAYFARRMRG